MHAPSISGDEIEASTFIRRFLVSQTQVLSEQRSSSALKPQAVQLQALPDAFGLGASSELETAMLNPSTVLSMQIVAEQVEAIVVSYVPDAFALNLIVPFALSALRSDLNSDADELSSLHRTTPSSLHFAPLFAASASTHLALSGLDRFCCRCRLQVVSLMT